jgi:phosphatidylserine/phosphatidylglycerophosphate/cardiolipin synthase-like enzyme
MERHIGRGVGKYIEKELFSAKNYVLVSSPDISPDLGEKLFEMTKRGVKVRVLTSNTRGADSDKTNQSAREFVKPKPHEVNSNAWSPPPLEYKIVSTKEIALIHAKIYVIDGVCAIVGSANLTENSFWNFAEYIHITRNTDEVKEIEADFEKIWNLYHDIELERPGVKKDLKEIIRMIRRKMP